MNMSVVSAIEEDPELRNNTSLRTALRLNGYLGEMEAHVPKRWLDEDALSKSENAVIGAVFLTFSVVNNVCCALLFLCFIKWVVISELKR